jgi:hypothetical protein
MSWRGLVAGATVAFGATRSVVLVVMTLDCTRKNLDARNGSL